MILLFFETNNGTVTDPADCIATDVCVLWIHICTLCLRGKQGFFREDCTCMVTSTRV